MMGLDIFLTGLMIRTENVMSKMVASGNGGKESRNRQSLMLWWLHMLCIKWWSREIVMQHQGYISHVVHKSTKLQVSCVNTLPTNIY